jgi:hypothetical protein
VVEEVTPPAVEPRKKRRTTAELKAHFLSKAQEAEERERAEVIRLVADAHDTLKEAMSLEAHKPHAQALNQIVNALAIIIARK